MGTRGKEAVDLSAPVKLMPRPPTLVVSKKTSMASLLLKSSTRRERSATGVVPSIRWYLRPAASTALSRMSSICCVWVNTRARCPCPCQASKTYSQHGATVTRPPSITSLHEMAGKTWLQSARSYMDQHEWSCSPADFASEPAVGGYNPMVLPCQASVSTVPTTTVTFPVKMGSLHDTATLESLSCFSVMHTQRMV